MGRPGGGLGFEPRSLPFIDEHSRTVAAPVEDVWDGLRRSLSASSGWPATVFAHVLGAHPARTVGDPLTVGSTLPGLVVVAAQPRVELVLAGRHLFSRYAMIVELGATGDSTLVRVATHAVFPGPVGRTYRALLLRSHGHVIAVNRLLASIDRRSRA